VRLKTQHSVPGKGSNPGTSALTMRQPRLPLYTKMLTFMNCIQARKQTFAAMKSCDFKEEYSEGYFRYKSLKYPKWFIGFSRQGKPRSGRNGATKHRYRHFIRYDLPNKTKRKHRRLSKQRKKKFVKLLQKKRLMRGRL